MDAAAAGVWISGADELADVETTDNLIRIFPHASYGFRTCAPALAPSFASLL